MVPVVDVGLEVALELLEVVPVAPAEELVLHVAEQALRAGVVEAVALAGHALGDAEPPEPPGEGPVLVLPAHVHLHDGLRALRHGLREPVEHLPLLLHVRPLRDRPRHDLPAAEVVDGREVGPAEGEPELRDVGAHLPPGAVRPEVAAEDVLEGLADLAPVGVVPVVVGLAAYAAPEPHLAHHLEDRLVRYALAVDGPQLHRYLAVADPVGEPAEDLGDPGAQFGPGGPLGVRQRVAVGRPGQRRRRQQVGKGVLGLM